MGEYYESMGRLELAAVEKDEAAVADTAEKMLSSIQGIRNFTESPLYGHVAFKNTESELFTGDKMKQNLIKMFKEDEAFRFMNDNARWQEFLEEN